MCISKAEDEACGQLLGFEDQEVSETQDLSEPLQVHVEGATAEQEQLQTQHIRLIMPASLRFSL